MSDATKVAKADNDAVYDRLVNNYDHHDSTEENFKKNTEICQAIFETASLIHEQCPEGREKSLAQTKLEEAMFWAVESLARTAPRVGIISRTNRHRAS